ncbi:hypothetical protein UO65_1722 [Actinokineospora spheciospongiae]|uniref:Uncharacterized protein n=1 Tax=Actinokineospora spheciospongiae TaxID=909613 RepID=W7IPZ1_9PSEU|nr:hypothetical protein [Actinokineospora spheciospongiae]EWC62955.1 hypothetical protein UO65_1722 [Actinokineospora spheciospongiae]
MTTGFSGGGVLEALVCFEQATVVLALCDGPELVVRTVNAAGRAAVGADLVGKPLPVQGHRPGLDAVLADGKEYRAGGVTVGGAKLDVVFRAVTAKDGHITGVTFEGHLPG